MTKRRLAITGPADGPTHLIIGARAPDEKLKRAAARLGVDFDALVAFRDQRPDGEVAHG